MKSRIGDSVATLIAGGLLTSVYPLSALAADSSGTQLELEEVVVTAERREADVQKIGVAVSVARGQDLAQQGRYSLDEILQGIPGVAGSSFTGAASTGSDVPENGIRIRGITSNGSNNNISSVPANAVYVDGVYGSVGSGYDIERVEVLRGPQGTLYGRSATGGVIATYTSNPNLAELEGYATAEAGNYSLRHYTAAVSVPLATDTLALRVAANYYDRDGFDSAAGGATKNAAARVKLLYRPSEAFSALLGFSLEDNTTHGGGVTYRMTNERVPGSYVADYSTPVGLGENHFRVLWGQFDWQFSGMKLTYIPSYRRWYNEGESYVVGPGGPLLRQYIKTTGDSYQVHELHLASQNDSRLSWQVGGLYWFNRVGHFTNLITWLSNGVLVSQREQSRDARDIGVFGEATYALTDSTRVTAGVRHDTSRVETIMDFRRNANSTGNVNDPVLRGTPVNLLTALISGSAGIRDYKNTTYKLRLEHDLTPQNLLYAMVSTGFIPGDIQVGAAVPLNVYDYANETVTAYEIGSKNRFLDNRLQINGAIYLNDYGGFQTTITPDVAQPTTQIVVSTPTKMKGLEVEVLYQATSLDRIEFSYGYISPKWVSKPKDFADAVEGDTIAGIPPYNGTLAWNHRFSLPGGSTLNFRAEGHFQGGYYTGTTTPALAAAGVKPYIYIGSQEVGNLNLNWMSSGGNFSVNGYVRNIADHRWRTANTIQTFTATSIVGTVALSDPRTYGASATYRF